jgi:tetratricopeptide (TPR) repeat protein
MAPKRKHADAMGADTTGTETDLHCADHPHWGQEPDYNPDVKASLGAAYAFIKRAPDRIAGFREAGYQVAALRGSPMCSQQRMNACYILALAYSADDEYLQALSALDQALDAAHTLCDRPAQIDLLFLRGFISQRIGRFDHALQDYRDGLALHSELRRAHFPVDHEQELMLLVGAAAFALVQEDYELSSRLFQAARRAARHVPTAPLTVTYHDWAWAVYLHARGKSERALQVALRAADALSRVGGNPHSLVLTHVFIARIALDLAATHPTDSIGRLTHLKAAGLSIRQARQSLAPNNPSGKGYIQIRQARLDSLSGREARALDRVRAAEQLARQVGDNILLVQALTVHGHVLAQRDDSWQAALSQYRQALAISEGSPFPLEGLPARRALRRLEEMHVDKDP